VEEVDQNRTDVVFVQRSGGALRRRNIYQNEPKVLDQRCIVALAEKPQIGRELAAGDKADAKRRNEKQQLMEKVTSASAKKRQVPEKYGNAQSSTPQSIKSSA
jgi:hypothetical protein